MRRSDHWSRGVLPSVVCLSVIVKPEGGDIGPLGAVVQCKIKIYNLPFTPVFCFRRDKVPFYL
jgi:hypothetical protein